MQIVRAFEHKDFGKLGAVEIVFPANDWTLNDKALPSASIKAIVNHGLQILQDAYAGSKSAAEAQGDFDKKMDALFAGTIKSRQRSPQDRIEAEVLRLARNIVSAALKAKGLKMEKDAYIAKVLEYKAKNVDRLTIEAEANIAVIDSAEDVDLSDIEGLEVEEEEVEDETQDA